MNNNSRNSIKTVKEYLIEEYNAILTFVSNDKTYRSEYRLFVKLTGEQFENQRSINIPYVLLKNNQFYSNDTFYMDLHLNVRPINKNELIKFKDVLKLLP